MLTCLFFGTERAVLEALPANDSGTIVHDQIWVIFSP